MRDKTHKRKPDAAVDLTPMLDVVFILLIFFIITSTFIQEKTIGLEPPPPYSGVGEPSPVIMIYVNDANHIRVNGKLLDIASVRTNLERLRVENPGTAAVVIAHPLARSGTIIQLRDQAYSARIDRVNIVRAATQR